MEQYRPFHDFLLSIDGTLTKAARSIPKLRAEIQSLPKTASSFTATQLAVENATRFDPIHYEFCKAWLKPEDYGPTGRRQRYVNPNYQHAHRFSDIIVDCRCGATVVRNYEDEQSPLDAKSAHNESCLPHWRLRARADMSEKRWRMIQRLGWLGWKGMDMGHRFGVTKNHCGSYARDYNFTLREAYNQYRVAAGKTAAYCITFIEDVTLADMADIYGHHSKSIRDWMKEHTAYQPRNGGGWKHDPAEIAKPEKVQRESIPSRFRWDAEAGSFVKS